jgi:hypothetical protein
MKVAEEMLAKLEAWYDAHPDASFGEIEQQARQERRELMGEVLAVLINGRDQSWGKRRCEVAGRRWSSGLRDWTVHGKETHLERLRLPECEGRRFSPWTTNCVCG